MCALAQNGQITASQQVARFKTNLGDIDVALLKSNAPKTVENFLSYVRKGSYNGTFFHRSVREFIIQAGGYTFPSGKVADIVADPPVVNEFNIANTRGTISMAKLGADPNSATNQWFFNLKDNRANLDRQNGGFTVFGRVVNQAGLDVMDAIGAVPAYEASADFTELPLLNYTAGATVAEANLVIVQSIKLVPGISGVVTAGNYGGYFNAAPGSFVEIYGVGMGESSRLWGGGDFSAGRAPTTLDDVSVTIGGKPAFVNYISPGQINAQVPGDAGLGTQPVVVTWKGDPSPAVNLTIRERSGGLLAPPAFRVGERQFVVAVHADGTLVSRGINGVPDSPALPGETILFYGVGFGPVSGSTPVAGQTVTALNSLTTAVDFRIDGATAEVSYAGLTPGLVGLYQFNVTVPQNASAGDLELQVRQGGVTTDQGILFLPVRRP